MKKTIFILVALFASTFANAQITLEYKVTIDRYKETKIPYVGSERYSTYANPIFLLGDIIKTRKNDTDIVVDLSTYSIVTIPKISSESEDDIWSIAKGYFTTDNRVCFVVYTHDGGNGYLNLYDENGTMLQDLGRGCEACGFFQLKNGLYKFYICRKVDGQSDLEIYSLPGNGETQDIVTLSSPKRSARKIARDGQVFIETGTNTYTLTGVEIK